MGEAGGFVWNFVSPSSEAIEFFDGAAVKALGLGLVTEESLPDFRFVGEFAESLGDGEIAILGAGDLDVADADQFGAHGSDGTLVARVPGFVDGGGEEAGFETSGAEDLLLSESNSFDRDEFLGIHRIVKRHGIGFEAGHFVELFEPHDGEGMGAETVLDRVLRRRGFAFGSARAGGFLRVRAVGHETFFGNVFKV